MYHLNYLPEQQQEQGVTPEDTKVEGRDEGATVDIQESLVVDPETKQTTKFYTLLDKAGELIPEEIFISCRFRSFKCRWFYK